MATRPYRELIGALAWLALGTRPDIAFTTSLLACFSHNPGHAHWEAVTKPTPYSNSTHFSDHFAYHIAFPLLSRDGQAHVRLSKQPPRSCAHDQELIHVTVSLIT